MSANRQTRESRLTLDYCQRFRFFLLQLHCMIQYAFENYSHEFSNNTSLRKKIVLTILAIFNVFLFAEHKFVFQTWKDQVTILRI